MTHLDQKIIDLLKEHGVMVLEDIIKVFSSHSRGYIYDRVIVLKYSNIVSVDALNRVKLRDEKEWR